MNVTEAGQAVEAFFAGHKTDFLSLGAGDFRQVNAMALCQRREAAVS